jgi:hypothetical protein
MSTQLVHRLLAFVERQYELTDHGLLGEFA